MDDEIFIDESRDIIKSLVASILNALSRDFPSRIFIWATIDIPNDRIILTQECIQDISPEPHRLCLSRYEDGLNEYPTIFLKVYSVDKESAEVILGISYAGGGVSFIIEYMNEAGKWIPKKETLYTIT